MPWVKKVLRLVGWFQNRLSCNERLFMYCSRSTISAFCYVWYESWLDLLLCSHLSHRTSQIKTKRTKIWHFITDWTETALGCIYIYYVYQYLNPKLLCMVWWISPFFIGLLSGVCSLLKIMVRRWMLCDIVFYGLYCLMYYLSITSLFLDESGD